MGNFNSLMTIVGKPVCFSRSHDLQYVVRYSTVQYSADSPISTVQYSSISIVQYSEISASAIRTMHYSTVQYSTVPFGTFSVPFIRMAHAIHYNIGTVQYRYCT